MTIQVGCIDNPCVSFQQLFGEPQNYIIFKVVAELLKNLKILGVYMPIKLRYLHSYLDKFPDNLSGYSEKQGNLFHQDIMAMEERYQGRCNCRMITDWYCTLQKKLLTRNILLKSQIKRLS